MNPPKKTFNVLQQDHDKLRCLALLKHKNLLETFSDAITNLVNSLTPNERAVYDSLIDVMELERDHHVLQPE